MILLKIYYGLEIIEKNKKVVFFFYLVKIIFGKSIVGEYINKNIIEIIDFVF